MTGASFRASLTPIRAPTAEVHSTEKVRTDGFSALYSRYIVDHMPYYKFDELSSVSLWVLYNHEFSVKMQMVSVLNMHNIHSSINLNHYTTDTCIQSLRFIKLTPDKISIMTTLAHEIT